MHQGNIRLVQVHQQLTLGVFGEKREKDRGKEMAKTENIKKFHL